MKTDDIKINDTVYLDKTAVTVKGITENTVTIQFENGSKEEHSISKITSIPKDSIKIGDRFFSKSGYKVIEIMKTHEMLAKIKVYDIHSIFKHGLMENAENNDSFNSDYFLPISYEFIKLTEIVKLERRTTPFIWEYDIKEIVDSFKVGDKFSDYNKTYILKDKIVKDEQIRYQRDNRCRNRSHQS